MYDEYIKRLDSLMLENHLYGGVLHLSIRGGIISDNVSDCLITSNIGLTGTLREDLNSLIDDIMENSLIPY